MKSISDVFSWTCCCCCRLARRIAGPPSSLPTTSPMKSLDFFCLSNLNENILVISWDNLNVRNPSKSRPSNTHSEARTPLLAKPPLARPLRSSKPHSKDEFLFRIHLQNFLLTKPCSSSSPQAQRVIHSIQPLAEPDS